MPRYGPAWRGVIFRRTYPELEEIIYRALEVYTATGAKWLDQKKTWAWPNGATLRLRYLEAERDATRYQGQQYTWIGWDELTQWATDYGYRYLIGRLRSPHKVATKRVRAAANPGGAGHQWVKERFVAANSGGYQLMIDAETGMRRMFIPSRLTDNRRLTENDPAYSARLRGLGSAELVRAWLEGDWDIVAGAFFDEWRAARHVIDPWEPPRHWPRFLAMDWGSAKPYAIVACAVAQEDTYIESRGGQVNRLARGGLVAYDELYGMQEGKPNVGVKQTAKALGRMMLERFGDLVETGHNVGDPAMWKTDGGPSILEELWEGTGQRLSLQPADNQRIPGWNQVRARLLGEDGDPLLLVSRRCSHLIRTLPVLQHDKHNLEDVDSDMEDHAPDALRYACMSRPLVLPKRRRTGPAQGSYDWMIQETNRRKA